MEYMHDEGENNVFVDCLSKTYVRHDGAGQNIQSSPHEFRGKNAQECFALLAQIRAETISVVHPRIFAIFDEQSLNDDTVIVVDMDDDDTARSARCEFRIACAKLNGYFIVDADIDEDIEEAEEEGDGVLRVYY